MSHFCSTFLSQHCLFHGVNLITTMYGVSAKTHILYITILHSLHVLNISTTSLSFMELAFLAARTYHRRQLNRNASRFLGNLLGLCQSDPIKTLGEDMHMNE